MTNTKFSFANQHCKTLIADSHSKVYKLITTALYPDHLACTALPKECIQEIICLDELGQTISKLVQTDNESCS